ncbi:MAG: GNAT family N-acetyltransferase [Bacteroidetes bacterium]|nr:GNAT family N-acetyltransferase [Bacteroidota bacterium]
MTEILKATIEDAEQIAELVNSGYRGEASRKGWTTEDGILGGTRIDAKGVRSEIMKDGTTVLKYVEAGSIIGCVELVHQINKMYLGMLTVKPDLQATGIGKKLLYAGEQHALKHSCVAMVMWVISVRSELIAWYQRHGYTPTGEFRPFDNTDPVFGIPKMPLQFMVLEKPLV